MKTAESESSGNESMDAMDISLPLKEAITPKRKRSGGIEKRNNGKKAKLSNSAKSTASKAKKRHAPKPLSESEESEDEELVVNQSPVPDFNKSRVAKLVEDYGLEPINLKQSHDATPEILLMLGVSTVEDPYILTKKELGLCFGSAASQDPAAKAFFDDYCSNDLNAHSALMMKVHLALRPHRDHIYSVWETNYDYGDLLRKKGYKFFAIGGKARLCKENVETPPSAPLLDSHPDISIACIINMIEEVYQELKGG